MKGEQSNAAQKAFAQAQSNSAEIMQKNARAIWDQQSEILNSMGNFALGWFKRRHVGVQASSGSQRAHVPSFYTASVFC